MKRSKWLGYIVLVWCLALACWILQGQDKNALGDSDTQLIIQGLLHHPQFGYWWTHDWPLANHFFRPLSTLLFQLDYAIHPTADLSWIQTNAILVAASVAALGWFVAELTESVALSSLCVVLFTVWIFDFGNFLTLSFWGIAILVLFLGIARHGFAMKLYGPASLLWVWVAYESAGMSDLFFRTEGWIPGRTATSMTVFACLSMAAYCRYCRLGPKREIVLTSSATDLPATKSDIQLRDVPAKYRSVWLIVSLTSLAAALACYEQGVMLPALLCLIAIYGYFKERKIDWWVAVPVCGLVAVYVAAHLAFVPHGASTYYNWQKQPLGMAVNSFQRYFLFPYWQLEKLQVVSAGGIMLWLFIDPWIAAVHFAASVTALWQARRKWLLCGFGWLGSSLAFLPMAFFKDFSHYHFWPMAIRTIWVVSLGWIAAELSATAVSPRVCQAPKRLRPSPGSLLDP